MRCYDINKQWLEEFVLSCQGLGPVDGPTTISRAMLLRLRV